MTNRDELRRDVAQALSITERCYMGAQSLDDMADAAIAAYEAHRPRAAVVLTREEWAEARSIFISRFWDESSDLALRAAFPFIRVEGE